MVMDANMVTLASEPYAEQVEILAEIFPQIARRILRSAVIHCRGDMDHAYISMKEKYPLVFGGPEMRLSTSTNGQSLDNVKKESTLGPASTAYNGFAHNAGIIPSFTLSLRAPPSPIPNIKTESSKPFQHCQSIGDIEPSSNLQETLKCFAPNSPCGSFKLDSDESSSVSEETQAFTPPSDPENPSGETETNDSGIIQEETDEKIQHLHNLFPASNLEQCGSILQACSNNVELAFDIMEQDGFGVLFDELLKNDDVNMVPGVTSGVPGEGKGKRALCDLPESSRGVKRGPEFWVDEIPRKKYRGLVESGNLAPSGVWVKETFSEMTSIIIATDEGRYPYKVPRNILAKNFSKFSHLRQNKEATPTVDIPTLNLQLLDIIIQWATCKQIQLDPLTHPTASSEIATVLQAIVTAYYLGMHDAPAFGSDMAKYISLLLREERNALKDKHIHTAFSDIFPAGHPIQELFIKAAIRPRLEFNDNGDPRNAAMLASFDREYADAAHRVAFRGHRFEFEEAMRDIPAFKLALLERSMDAWSMRERVHEKRRGNGKKVWVTYVVDPLDGERFEI